MIRALWFFLQIAVLVVGALWLLERPGSVVVDALGYTFTVQAGLFLLGTALTAFILFFAFRLLSGLLSIPSGMSRFFTRRAREKGYRDLTRGFVAVAAGDAAKAHFHARRVKQYLPDEKGLPLLLQAQAARMNGQDGDAIRAFEKLLTDKDASFFGIRGLLKDSLDKGDALRALDYARKAQSLHPKQGWVVRAVYDLEIRARQWDDAGRTLKRAEKIGAVTSDNARRDRVAMDVMQSDVAAREGNAKKMFEHLERAHRTDPLFAPVIARLADVYFAKDKPRKVQAMVEKAFPVAPHPILAAIWDRLAPTGPKKDSMRVMRWYEKLVTLNPDTPESHLAAARAAMHEELYGEARAYLKNAEKIQGSAELYRLRARLEEKSGGDAASVRGWLEKAADASPSKVWTCRETGRVYDGWSPIALPHGSFNTIVWDYAGAARKGDVIGAPNDLMIDAA